VIQQLLCDLLTAYLIVIFARIILSWFPLAPDSVMATVFGFLYSITEPVLGPIRRVIPPLGMGGMGLDLSPLIVIFGIQILQRTIC
jgi:YggT family protein